MVAFVLAGLLTTGLAYVVHMFSNMKFEIQSEINLTNNARLIIDRMVWGVTDADDDRRGIWQARDFEIIDENELNFTDVDGDACILQVNGLQVEYIENDEDPVMLYDPTQNGALPIEQFSTDVIFTQTTPNVIQIQIVLGERVQDRWFFGSVSTHVAVRN
jgi:hypothetical protein